MTGERSKDDKTAPTGDSHHEKERIETSERRARLPALLY